MVKDKLLNYPILALLNLLKLHGHLLLGLLIIYAAPEVKQRESALYQMIKIDIYSFGVLLIEMLTKQVPTDGIEVLMR